MSRCLFCTIYSQWKIYRAEGLTKSVKVHVPTTRSPFLPLYCQVGCSVLFIVSEFDLLPLKFGEFTRVYRSELKAAVLSIH